MKHISHQHGSRREPYGDPQPAQADQEDVTRELGQTSDEYPPEGRDPIREMTPGDELARNNPDVTQIGPPGGGDIDRGFRDQTQRRD